MRSLRRADGGFVVDTSKGVWRAANVVIATGWCDKPHVPRFADRLPAGVSQLTPNAYRSPDELPLAGSSSWADRRRESSSPTSWSGPAGRSSWPSAGTAGCPAATGGWTSGGGSTRPAPSPSRSTRSPDPAQARAEGALQLIGRDDHRDVDLPALQRLGVRLAGRLVGIDGNQLDFAPDLRASTAAADERLARLLARIDDHITRSGLDAEVLRPTTTAGLHPAERLTRLDLRREGVGAVLWATGYRRPYPWLQVPVLDRRRGARHRRGVTPVEGLYVMGQRFQYRRDSNFIDGVRHDAAYLAEHIAARRRQPPSASHRERRGPPWTSPPPATTSSSSAHAPPGPPPRCCSPGPVSTSSWWTAAATAPTPCPPTRSCAAASSSSTAGGCSTQVIAAGTPAVRRTRFTYADDEVTVTIKPSHGVDALYAPRRTVLDPILVDAAVGRGGAGPLRDDGRRHHPRSRRPGGRCRSAATRMAGRCVMPRAW